MRNFFVKIFLFSLILLLAAPAVKAQGNSQTLSVSPFLIELENLEPGQSTPYSIDVTNGSANLLKLTVVLRDFTAGPEGRPIFASESSAAGKSFSLSSWITLQGPKSIKVPAFDKVRVNFIITPPSDIEPGTHYGAVLFSYADDSAQQSSAKIENQIGTLIFAKSGKAQPSGRISSFQAAKKILFESSPIKFNLQFDNSGNVHLKPKGEIEIKNWFGDTVATIPLNRDASIVLPQSSREFSNTFDSRLPLGKYTATVKLYYGDNRLEANSQVTFWVIPIVSIAISILLAAAAITLFYLLIRAYNRRLLSRQRQ